MPASVFRFGDNWKKLIESLSVEQVKAATESLYSVLGPMDGKWFLDVGSGSGLHSLAAFYLGASRIHSFDYDEQSVYCTSALKERFGKEKPHVQWTVEKGSALDREYLTRLGQFDVVYSWGVLHHTGDLWSALDAVTIPAQGVLFISIYNDQGWKSRFWKRLKHRYVDGSRFEQRLLEYVTFALTWGKYAFANCVRLHPLRTFKDWKHYSATRGMSPWTDVVDWAGGYPFEVARPEDVISFVEQRGFAINRTKLCGRGKGCNEFIFRRTSLPSS